MRATPAVPVATSSTRRGGGSMTVTASTIAERQRRFCPKDSTSASRSYRSGRPSNRSRATSLGVPTGRVSEPISLSLHWREGAASWCAWTCGALCLARVGARVALVDRRAFPRDKACGDLVGPRGVRLLDELGVLPAIHAAGARRVGDMIVV